MPGLLASVRSAVEAQLAVQGGADIIDAKDPSRGALGALPAETIAAIVDAVGGRVPISATVGDLPCEAEVLGPALRATNATGVDFVKFGVFATADAWQLERCLAALAELPGRPDGRAPARRIAVLMADQGGVAWPLAPFARHGIAGVMLDTADKRTGGLRSVLEFAVLHDFVERARALGLLVGLAGSLQLDDVTPLCALSPDYLGFRTALCGRAGRAGDLDPVQLSALRQRIDAGLSAPLR
jgi:dihydroneopterin aldolase